nr:hypothetical protein [Pseudomonas sp. ALS1131]
MSIPNPFLTKHHRAQALFVQSLDAAPAQSAAIGYIPAPKKLMERVMPAIVRIGLSALATLVVLYFSPQLLPHLLVLLPESVAAALPIGPFILNLLLSSLLAGVCLALLASNHRLATAGLVALGLLGIYAFGFYSNLCSVEETQRIHAEMEAMPMYNLGRPADAEPIAIDPIASLSYACILPEDRSDNLFTMTWDFLVRLAAVIAGTLLVPRRRSRTEPLAH